MPISLSIGLGLTRGAGVGGAPFSMTFPASPAAVDADFANNQYWANGGSTTLAALLTQQIVTATPTFVLNADGTYSLNSGGTQSLRRSTHGLLIDGDRTDSARYTRDFTQTNWVKTNVTALKNAASITGVANTASTLTFAAAGGTALQTLTATIRGWRLRPMIKRTGGTGIVELTIDNITWTDITAQLVNGSYVRVTGVPDVTMADPTFGIRGQGVGDTVVVDCFDLCGDNVVDEWGPCSPTTTTSVKTWRDRPAAYNTDSSPIATYLKSATTRCIYAELTFKQAGAIFATDGDFGASIGLSNASVGAIVTANAGIVSTYSLANVNKVMVWRTAGETGICLNGGAIARGAGGAPDPAHTHTDLMTNGAGNLSTMGGLRRFICFNAVPTDLQIIAATT
jgi:hypothetical protein